MRLHFGKANAVGPEFFDRFDEALERVAGCDEEGAARPLIVTGQGSAFSAGLDLPTLIEYPRERLREFFVHFDRALGRLACLDRPTVAAVNGHAVAGGAILLLACDRRLGASALVSSGKPYFIGLKESALGVPLPRVAYSILADAVGRGAAALEIALTGDLFSPEDSLRLGILHRVVPPDELESAAEQEAARLAQSTSRAAAILKRELKTECFAALDREPDNEAFLDAWFSAETQRRIRRVVDRLGRGG